MAEQHAAAASTDPDGADALATVHKLKLKPPGYDGNYATFDEWKYKFTAYMGIQDPIYPTLMERAEQATTAIAESQLTAGANTTQEGEHWIQLAANLKYVLITITTAAAATVVRQHHLAMGLEVYRQLCLRFSTPLGTRSIGYLTKLQHLTTTTLKNHSATGNSSYNATKQTTPQDSQTKSR